MEKDAEHWVLHGGCLNEVGNLYGGSETMVRVGEAINEEMVLERKREDKKDEEKEEWESFKFLEEDGWLAENFFHCVRASQQLVLRS